MIPLALTLHLLGTPLSLSPVADLRMVPELRLSQLTAVGPGAPSAAPTQPDRTSLHLFESLAGAGTYLGGEVVEGGLDLVILVVALGGTLTSGSGSTGAGVIVGAIAGWILVSVASWIGIPLLVAFVENGVASAMGDPGNLLVGALGGFVGQSAGDLLTLLVLLLDGGFASSSSGGATAALFLGALLIVPICSAIGASFGLHLIGSSAAPGIGPSAPQGPAGTSPPSAPPPMYSPPPDYVAPPPPPPLPESTPAPVYPPSTFFMLPAVHFS